MTSINLVLRLSTRGSGDTGSISLRLIHNRQVKSITLPGCRLYVTEWDRVKQQIVYPENSPRRWSYLTGVESKIVRELEIVQSFLRQLEKNGPYTVDDLMALYREKKGDGKLSGYTEVLRKHLIRNGQYRTAEAYRTVVRGLVRYNQGADIPLDHLNAALIKGFEKYLKSQGKLPNTVAYYMRNLRAIYNKAVAENRIVTHGGENPFAGISTAVTKTMKRALSMDEIRALYHLDFSAMACPHDPSGKQYLRVQNLSRAWRYFFFCFYARGMSFIDLAYLRKDNIRSGFIRYCRKKTGQQIEIRVTEELFTIIESFAQEVVGSEYVFPIIRDNHRQGRHQYESAMRIQNERLKRLASLAGIKRSLSTHVARHSWASAGKVLNLPIEVISECLGHDSPMTTLIYTARLENRLLDDANEVVARAIRGKGSFMSRIINL